MTNTSGRAPICGCEAAQVRCRAQIHWPVCRARGSPRLLTLFPAGTAADQEIGGLSEADVLCQQLCAQPGLMGPRGPCRNTSAAIRTAERAADHPCELGADASTITLAGMVRALISP
jgi:hypothetical protein